MMTTVFVVAAAHAVFLAQVAQVRDIGPGASGGKVSWVTAVGSRVYFLADDGTHGVELWVSDGTASGTGMVQDLAPGALSGGTGALAALDGTLYLFGVDPGNGQEPRRLRGSVLELVADLTPGAGGSGGGYFARTTSNVFLAAQTATQQSEVYVVTTTGSAEILTDIVPGTNGSFPVGLVGINDLLYFNAFSPELGLRTAFVSDGTPAGTHPLRSTAPVPEEPFMFTALSGSLVIFAANAGGQMRLWQTDGSESGTAPLVALQTGDAAGRSTFVTSGSVAYMVGVDGTHGGELWRCDGTTAGTRMVRELVVGPSGGATGWLVALGETVFLAATDGNNGVELWKSDGTEAGTQMVLDALPGMAGIAPTHLAAVPAANVIVFSAEDPDHGREVWVSDGTPGGTRLLADIRPGRESSQAGAQAGFVVAWDRVYFTADDGTHGAELWSVTAADLVRAVTNTGTPPDAGSWLSPDASANGVDGGDAGNGPQCACEATDAGQPADPATRVALAGALVVVMAAAALRRRR